MSPLPEAVLKGIGEFNRREFFESHETLEDAWNEESGVLRIFYQGLIQIAVGCAHIQRGNFTGAGHMLARGQAKLAETAAFSPGIDAKALLAAAASCEDEMRRLGPERIAEFDPARYPVLILSP